MEKYKELIKNIIIFAVGGLGSKIILFLLVPIYTIYLTPVEYGISELVFTISQFLIPIITLNIFDALIRFGLSNQENRCNVVLTSFLVWGIGSIFLLLSAFFFHVFHSFSEWKWYLVSYVIFFGLSQIELNYLKIIDKNFLYSGISIVQTFVLAICNILLIVVFKSGIRGYLLSNVLSLVFTCIICFLAGKLWSIFLTAKLDQLLTLRMIKYSLPLIGNNISWWLVHSTDKMMINWLIGASILGIYTVSAKIPSLLNVVSGFFIQAWGLSSIKEIETSNDFSFYANIFKFFTGFIFLLCVVINSFIKPFMHIYTGVEFASAWQYVPALLVAASFNAVSLYFAAFYAALKKTVNNMITTMISAFINIIVNYVFILKIGIWGAVIGTLSSYFIIAYLRMLDVRRYIKIEIEWKSHIFSVIVTIVHMLCVTVEFYTFLISLLSITILLIINKSEIILGINLLQARINRA